MPTFLENMRLLNEGFGNIRTGLDRDRAAQQLGVAQQLRQQLGDQVTSGAPSAQIQGTAARIDPMLYAHLATVQQKQKPAETPMTTADYVAQGVPQKQADYFGSLAGKGAKFQSDAFSNYAKTGSMSVAAGGLADKNADLAERQQNNLDKARESFNKQLSDPLKKQIADIHALEVTKNMEDTSSLGYASKSMKFLKDNAGRINERELEMIFPHMGFKAIKEAMNYFSLNPEATGSPEQRAALNNIIEQKRQSMIQENQSAAAAEFSTALNIHAERLTDKNGRLDPSVISAAKKFNLQPVKKDGQWTVQPIETKAPPRIETDLKGDYGQIGLSAAKIKDKSLKSSAIKKLLEFQAAGKPVPPEMVQLINSLSGGQ